jgi:tetratricopeptide (TPR) repeat protein
MAADPAARAEELKTLANNAVSKSDFAAAVKHLTDAVALRPKAKELWSNRAFAWSALGQHEEALTDATHCISLAPTFSKGYLRAGRALIALGRREEAVTLLEDAAERMPQDYSLLEALEDALSSSVPAALGSAAGSSSGATPPTMQPQAGLGKATSTGAGGLESSYYYAAVPASERKLPVSAPQRIDAPCASGGAAAAAAGATASGHVKLDIERKGADSYYYAHDRKTDFTVPTVPKKLNADGSMTPWDGR